MGRYSLSGDAEELAKELAEVTGLGSVSTVLVVLLSRYGNHLRSTWSVEAPSVEASSSKSVPASVPPPGSATPPPIAGF